MTGVIDKRIWDPSVFPKSYTGLQGEIRCDGQERPRSLINHRFDHTLHFQIYYDLFHLENLSSRVDVSGSDACFMLTRSHSCDANAKSRKAASSSEARTTRFS